ncbi:uncharacterized protein [Bemisia tabaci]|uniref:uncharacterized protein n=1 Tax=Bemisia tabaci TaxID=7038 RepID=UPI003B28608B
MFVALSVVAFLAAAHAAEYPYYNIPATSQSYYGGSYQQYPSYAYAGDLKSLESSGIQYAATPEISSQSQYPVYQVRDAAPVARYESAIATPVARSHHAPCPAPVPEIKPVVVKSNLPVPYTYGVHREPQVIEHHSAPSVFHYYGQPYIVKHTQGAVLHAYTQKPVVVDEYEHPQVHEAPAKPAVIVEEVCPPVEPCHS